MATFQDQGSHGAEKWVVLLSSHAGTEERLPGGASRLQPRPATAGEAGRRRVRGAGGEVGRSAGRLTLCIRQQSIRGRDKI